MSGNGALITDIATEASRNSLSNGYTKALANMDWISALQSSYVAPELSAANFPATLNTIPSGALDQNVQIEANFPNVANHTEIELSLNNLILSASQFAHWKQ